MEQWIVFPKNKMEPMIETRNVKTVEILNDEMTRLRYLP